MHAKLSILLQSRNIVYQYFTTCNKFSHISLLFVSKKMFHSDIERTYLGCWRTTIGSLEHRAQRPCSTKVSMANLSRTVVSVPRPPARSTAIHSSLQRGGCGGGSGSCRTGHRDSVLLTVATKRARPRVEEAVPKDYHDRYVYMVISWIPEVDLSQLTMVEILLSAFKPFVTAVTK